MRENSARDKKLRAAAFQIFLEINGRALLDYNVGNGDGSRFLILTRVNKLTALVASWQIKNINGFRASLPVEIFDVQPCSTSNGYKPGVISGGPDGQILNRVFDDYFFRTRFFYLRLYYSSTLDHFLVAETEPLQNSSKVSSWLGQGIKVPVPGSTVHQ